MENRIIMNALKNVIKDKNIIEIYNDKNNTNNCIVGFICYADDYSVLINSLSPDGKYDGFVAIKTNDIYTINIDSLYISGIVNKIKSKIEYDNIEQISSNQIVNILFYSKNNNKKVSIMLYDSHLIDACGIVTDIDEKYIVIKTLNSESVSIISIDSISEIDCDGEYENNC